MNYRDTACPLVREFLNYHEVIRGHSQRTVDGYYNDIKVFLGWYHMQERPRDENAQYDESITVEQLSLLKKEDIYDYMTWLSREKRNGSTSISRKISALKSFFAYLVTEKECLPENPTLTVKTPKKPKKIPSVLNDQQAEQLIAAPSGTYELRDTTILLLFLTCGLRVSELVGLDLNDVTKEYVKVLGKGNKERIVYMSDAMRKQMRNYLDMRYKLVAKPGHEKALFLSRLNKRICVRRIQKLVDQKCQAAGLDSRNYSPHKLRHTAATLLLKEGIDVRVLQEILGHERLDTTQIYTHVDDADLRLAAKASHLGEKKKNSEET